MKKHHFKRILIISLLAPGFLLGLSVGWLFWSFTAGLRVVEELMSGFLDWGD